MKKYVALFVFFCLTLFVKSQNYSQLSSIALTHNGTDWVKFKASTKIKSTLLMKDYLSIFGLNVQDNSMKMIRSITDKLGQQHDKYQQLYKGKEVEGAIYILHSSNGLVSSCNGKLISGLSLEVKPNITTATAIQKAISFVNAQSYMWEDAQMEGQLKTIKQNPNATYYPKPELVIADKKYGKDAKLYRLVYKMEIYASNPLKKLLIFVDAQNGSIYHFVNLLKNADKPGWALTQYNGTRPVMVDSVNSSTFRLRESGRGNGIVTHSLGNTMNYTGATDLISNSSYFSADKIANSAHWGAEKTYDYYLQIHGRNSFDNQGGTLYSYVHYSTNYSNAFWDGTRMTYGDGGAGYGPFTALDVCGHEITHGVSENEANFIYQDEPGSLSESFSDIFGTSIEFFADSLPNWLIGEDIGSSALRSLQNPKLYQQPDTYHGQYWNFDPNSDNGGVHDNNSIGNYWFYMLCMGDTGTNDNGFQYAIHSIGMDTAQKIAYRTLTTYLTPTSQYIDWYFGSIEAANDLYGSCSGISKEVAKAWYAAGVGYPLSTTEVFMLDITSPATACGLNNVSVGLNLYYAGCDSALSPGKKIVMAYKMDSNPLVYDTLTLSAPWNGGDTLHYIFSNTANVSSLGAHTLNCYSKLGTITPIFTDSVVNYHFTNILHQNVDLAPTRLVSPISGCGLHNENVIMKFAFLGCDSLPIGTSIPLSFKVNAQTAVTENYLLPSTLFANDTVTYTFNAQANLTNEHGLVQIETRTAFLPDTFVTNNLLLTSISNPNYNLQDTITFEETNPTDLFFVYTTAYSHALVSVAAHNTGYKGFQMTGGNPFDYINNITFPDGTNNWDVNDFLSAKIGFCIDASAWTETSVRFDLKQTHGGTMYAQYLGPNDYTNASSLRLLANGNQVGITYKPTTAGSDPFKTHYVNLNALAGTKFILEFESRCISKDTTYIGFPAKMDNVYLDNICITEHPQGFENIENNKAPDFTAEVFPNPINDWYMLNLSCKGSQSVQMDVLDVNGRLLGSEKREAIDGHNAFIFKSVQLQKGIYFIKIQGKNNNATLKIIKS